MSRGARAPTRPQGAITVPIMRNLSPANVADYLEDDFHTGADHKRHPDRPHLTRLFAEQLTRLNMTTDGSVYEGALPDLELDPREVTPQIERELRGVQVSVPAYMAWGEFGGVRPLDDGASSVTIAGREVTLPFGARIHISSRAWREAGGGEITPLSGHQPQGALHGDHRSSVERPETSETPAAVRVQPGISEDAAARKDGTTHLNTSVPTKHGATGSRH